MDPAAAMLPLVVIVAGAALFRHLARRIGQPAVLGELALGLALGASLFGWAHPAASQALFPASAREPLEAVAWIGLALFMFIVGSEMRWRRGDGKASMLVAWGGLILPLLAGLFLAMARPDWFGPGGASAPLVILVALVMSVSALPVLARILEDTGLAGSRLASVTLGAGTIDDLLAWVLLAVVVSAAHVGLTGNLLLNMALVALLLGGAWAADRAFARAMAGRVPRPGTGTLALPVAAILGSAMLTEAAGLHAVLGPLAVGAIVGRHPELRAYAHERLQGLTIVLFLPTFFVLAGLATDLTLLASGAGLLALAAVMAVASAAKLLGAWLGGAAAGLPARERVMAGVLLNARGAVGLVVARVGLEEGLLSASGFALLVAVIVATTMAAPPVLQWLARERPAGVPVLSAPAARAASARPK